MIIILRNQISLNNTCINLRLSSSCRRCWSTTPRSIHVSLMTHHGHHRVWHHTSMTMSLAISLIPLITSSTRSSTTTRWPCHHSSFLPLHLPVLVQVNLERVHILLEPQCGHGPQQVITVDGFPLLLLALIRGFTCYEADELRHALLHGFLGLLGDLGVRRQRLLHDPAHVGYGKEPVLLSAPREFIASTRVTGWPSWIVIRISHNLTHTLLNNTNAIVYI